MSADRAWTPRAAGPPSAPRAASYLHAAARRGATEAELLTVRTHRDEVTAVRGVVDLALSLDFTTVSLRLVRGARSSYVTAGASADPSRVAQRAADLLDRLPERPAPVPRGVEGARRPATPIGRRGSRDELEALLTRLAAARGDQQVEIRAWTETRVVRAARLDGFRDDFAQHLSGATVRVTSRAREAVGHSVQSGHCADGHLDGRLLPSLLARARARADALARFPEAGALPPTIVLDAPVAGQVLAPVASALLADAVGQRRSRFRDLLGTTVAGRGLDLVDDAMAHGPLRAPFDDEGVPTQRRVLVRDGTLIGLLADRVHAHLDGARPGSAWKPWDTAPPRPRASNLLLSSRGGGLHGRYLRIVEIRGGHTANEVTGDFSFGASALLEDSGEVCGAVRSMSVAGNAFEVFRNCHGVQEAGEETGWSGVQGAYLGNPDLVVEGVVIGR